MKNIKNKILLTLVLSFNVGNLFFTSWGLSNCWGIGKDVWWGFPVTMCLAGLGVIGVFLFCFLFDKVVRGIK